jgi:cysteinyl-tRNA synthetase
VDTTELRGTWSSVRAMLDVLGLDPFSPTWSGRGTTSDLHGVVGRLVEVALQERAEARARQDWAAADRVRDALTSAGVVVEDTPSGPRWTLAEEGS